MNKSIKAPNPEDRERKPRLMPDGSLDWQWFYSESDILKTWLNAGLCVDCGDADCKAKNALTFLWTCSFCGSAKNIVGGAGSPIHPVWVQCCSGCSGRHVPSRDEAIGQGKML